MTAPTRMYLYFYNSKGVGFYAKTSEDFYAFCSSYSIDPNLFNQVKFVLLDTTTKQRIYFNCYCDSTGKDPRNYFDKDQALDRKLIAKRKRERSFWK